MRLFLCIIILSLCKYLEHATSICILPENSILFWGLILSVGVAMLQDFFSMLN